MNDAETTGYGRIGYPPKEDETLTHVGPGTPMGELLRRYWQPVALSSELGDLAMRVRILGEDLVAFRDRSGRAGLLDMHCAHRGTSLEYGRIEDEGIRCCYHGWLFDAEGRCLDQPGEPEGSDYKDKVRQPWYPVQEYHGLVFAYMGPYEKKPAFPSYDILEQDGVELIAYRNYSRGIVAECNWLQIHENAIDPIHLFYLHSSHSGVQHSRALATKPDLDFQETPTSVYYVRKATLPNRNRYIRMGELFVPNARSLPWQSETGDRPREDKGRFIGWWVPVDDARTIGFHIEALPIVDGVAQTSVWADAEPGRSYVGQPANQTYEDSQRNPDDMEAQVSQRPITIHALENLGTTDRGIAMFRRKLRTAVAAVQAGEDPPGISYDPGGALVAVTARNVVALPDEAAEAVG